MNPNAMVAVGVIGGFFAASFFARYNAQVVNSLLVLILIGVVFSNADKWLPYLTSVGNAQIPGKTTPAPSTPSPDQTSPPQTLVGAGG
jgi:hypothetical protein